jgi:hypothetical protein
VVRGLYLDQSIWLRFKIEEVDLTDRWLLIAQRILGVLAPVIGSANDDAASEGLLTGRL